MRPTTSTQFTESLAVRFLKKKRYAILTQNYQYNRLGEIDIVAFYDGVFRFIEVKGHFVSEEQFETAKLPVHNFTAQKVRTIGHIAQYYLLECRQTEAEFTIEGIALVVSTQAKRARIQHLPDLSQGMM